jgi:cysteinyl-tRNA synthetase
MERGFAYEAKDNSIYFSIDKFKDYGKLSRLDKSGIKIGARVEKDEYNKENPADFALWKAWDEDDGEIFWETSLGKGRPGWHIECSTMANDVLGETIDIHAGAVDLIFPHHENEIAQSEAKNGKPFVKYWIHGEHLLVDGKKMSKSLGNLYSLGDLEKKGFSPMDLRYLVFGTQYRSKLNFTWEGLTSAKNARERLSRFILENKSNEGQILDKYLDAFMSKVNDDLDTSAALAVLWEMIRDENAKAGDKSKTFFEMNKIIGLVFQETKSAPKEVAILAEERKKAREDKDFQKSDEIRNQIEDLGWVIEDLPENRYELKEY